MAFSKGRSNMQASIEDSATLLNSLIDEMDTFYSNKLTEYESKIELIKKENPQESPEVLESMCYEWIFATSVYHEFFMETKQMLITKVYSYAEKHLNELLSMIGYNQNKYSKMYEKKHSSTKGISDIEKCCYVLQNHYGLDQNLLNEYWPMFKDFHDLRRDIIHHDVNIHIDTKMIKCNLDNALQLLKHIELITREKIV